MTRKAWSHDEIREVDTRRGKGETIQSIADAMGRTYSSVQAHLSSRAQDRGITKYCHERTQPAPPLSPSQLADRDRRAAAREARNFTQSFFGDPPPGYSARDGMKGMCR